MNLGQEVPADLAASVENIQHDLADLGVPVASPAASGVSSFDPGVPLIPMLAVIVLAIIVIR